MCLEQPWLCVNYSSQLCVLYFIHLWRNTQTVCCEYNTYSSARSVPTLVTSFLIHIYSELLITTITIHFCSLLITFLSHFLINYLLKYLSCSSKLISCRHSSSKLVVLPSWPAGCSPSLGFLPLLFSIFHQLALHRPWRSKKMAAKKNCPVFPAQTLKFLIYSISIISALLSHHQTFTTTHLTTRAPSHPFPPVTTNDFRCP